MEDLPAHPQAGDVEDIFAAALALSPAERPAYLSAACGSNLALRRRIEALLRAHKEAEGFLPEQPKGHPAVPQLTEQPGDKIGRYRIMEKIGEGGCGIVYVAEQEEPVRRKVALKVIKLGMDTREVVARFEAERQALALMDHPNIARVFDAGMTGTPVAAGVSPAATLSAGRPYFVMELVRGVRITDFCNQHQLTLVERLKLFIQVCHAIQHAHQKGIIHRDIKPSNILVSLHDDVPVPKVIDFGIAKAIGERLTDKTLYTRFEQFIGTPAYMSPEQAGRSDLDVDTRTDIYALGVLLYELLTGSTPFDTQELLKVGLEEMLRTIREKEPVRPSTRIRQTASVRGASRQPPLATPPSALATDLDWIVMKCLEKNRTRRYETANGLARDIEAYLNHEVVIARQPSTAYRLSKFVRRNKVMVGAASAVALTLVLGIVGSTWQAVRASRQKIRAEANEQKALAAEAKEVQLRKEAQAQLYASDMNVACQAIENNNLGLARQLIREYLPNGQHAQDETEKQTGVAPREDLRGWEWRFLWRKCQGDSLATLRGHSSFATCAVFSPNGKILVTASFDRTARIWDVVTERTMQCLTGFASPLQRNSVAFSPDGALLAVADGTEIHVFETWTWGKTHTLPNQTLAGAMFSLPIAFSPDGKILLCNADTEIRQWYTGSWERCTNQLRNLAGEFGRLLSYSPDGSRFATATLNSIVIWDAFSDTPSPHFFGPLTWPTAVVFSPDSKYVAAVGIEGLAVVWDAKQGKEIRRWSVDSMFPLAVEFSHDGRRLATAGADQIIGLWDIEQGKLLTSLKGHHNEIWALAFSPDGRTLVSSSKDGTARLWTVAPELAAGRKIPRGRPLQFSSDSRTLALLSTNSSVEYWDVRSGNLVSSFSIPDAVGQLDSVGVSPDARLLAFVGTNGFARVWDRGSGERIDELVLDPPPKWPWLNFSPDNRLLAISCRPRDGGGGGWSIVWDFRLGVRRALPKEDVYRPTFSPDGRILATGSGNNVQLWSLPDLAPLATLRGHEWTINSLAFSPDGSMLASGGRDIDIRLWDVATGGLRALFRHGVGPGLSGAAFSPDGRTLASRELRLVKLWNVATGKELLTMRGFGRHAVAPMFSPDGNTLLAGGSAFVTDLAPVELHQAPSLAEIDAAEAQQAKAAQTR